MAYNCIRFVLFAVLVFGKSYWDMNEKYFYFNLPPNRVLKPIMWMAFILIAYRAYLMYVGAYGGE